MKSYHDLAGDGGSNIGAQVDARLERVARNLEGVGTVLAIGSGKGGVGKSTVTALVASALSRRGLRVAILDADLNGPSQGVLNGLGSAPLLPVEGGLLPPRGAEGFGVVSLGSLLGDREALEFASVAEGESHVWRATRELSLLRDLLATVLWGELDVLLVDLPPGAERTFQYAEVLGPRTAFVLVSAPSDLARGVVARSLEALARAPNRILGWVENMSGYVCADCGEVKPLFPKSQVDLPLACLGEVPFDPRFAAQLDRGIPPLAGPDCPTSAAVLRLVDRIAAALVLEPRAMEVAG